MYLTCCLNKHLKELQNLSVETQLYYSTAKELTEQNLHIYFKQEVEKLFPGLSLVNFEQMFHKRLA
jgi:hypothetical protein